MFRRPLEQVFIADLCAISFKLTPIYGCLCLSIFYYVIEIISVVSIFYLL